MQPCENSVSVRTDTFTHVKDLVELNCKMDGNAIVGQDDFEKLPDLGRSDMNDECTDKGLDDQLVTTEGQGYLEAGDIPGEMVKPSEKEVVSSSEVSVSESQQGLTEAPAIAESADGQKMDGDTTLKSDENESKVENNVAFKSNTDKMTAGMANHMKVRHTSSNGSSGEGVTKEVFVEEDSGYEGEMGTQGPCECDDCLMNEDSEKPKVDPQEKKLAVRQSSWRKIRNIVHWSPFIQQFKRRRYPWIQLAGHQGNFQAGEPGAILKKYDSREHRAFTKLMKDKLRPYVPEYRGEAAKDGDCYLQLQDLLCEFEAPCVMDMKMGCRTYLEEELVKAREKPALRKDMYQKMVEVDPTAPTQEEHDQGAITKPRYMQWRDDMSSSTELGFRIEGIRKSDGAQVKNFKTTKDKGSVKQCLKLFIGENPSIITKYLRRLKAIRATQEDSPFFQSHEIIGSSLLFVHDKVGQASIWMIDFGKTVPLPKDVSVTHKDKWVEGNHEDGYLFGVDSLIDIFEELHTEFSDSADTSDNVNSCSATESSDSDPHQKLCPSIITDNSTLVTVGTKIVSPDVQGTSQDLEARDSSNSQKKDSEQNQNQDTSISKVESAV